MTLFMPLIAMFLNLAPVAQDRPVDMPTPILCHERVVCHQFQVAGFPVADSNSGSVRNRTDPRPPAVQASVTHLPPRNPP
ncbi:MAG TPA: hypothetical protein VM240_11380 [Verrucomicrobiae bacterium]|nr:hypothetical protein [Verrucomicrobiae bacterium]